jgi:hypothetical protein
VKENGSGLCPKEKVMSKKCKGEKKNKNKKEKKKESKKEKHGDNQGDYYNLTVLQKCNHTICILQANASLLAGRPGYLAVTT